ncbi:G/U mismatch-specific DNA glycosylase [Marinitenerispora sediminis]|uniref:G/U mismatch-specific DNA glycosylase n=1 Tax=Marinitenerispora sediminis TaxID=1931232 RepID=A0A368T929_9ACTN|nr:G/U mismatch-specific DNA glycosylase [Marinitenerispora sediminis]RCV52362.1 G/U mismatch-specific DNA glycosylase [Marinitenerispora sediminis]RCV60927.1 G/U mismatch-specific DNA glycosylase [Marinitenerispora sediminis]RCV62218.1 G/U mismatch-specific DNA glycosylase [Marinitenerispora sediminis]
MTTSPAAPPRPTREQLAAAHGRTIPDVLGPRLDVLFCGINPGLYSGYTGHHFARPGNRFWPALHRSGCTPRLLRPAEQHLLPEWGFGITNLVARATARADELTPEELREGGRRLTRLLREYRPRVLAVLGVTAYRQAFARPRAQVGPQPDRIADTPVWVLPNPSGLNAHWTVATIADELTRMRREASAGPAGQEGGAGAESSPHD